MKMNIVKTFVLLILLLAVATIQRLYTIDSNNLEKLRPIMSELQAYCALEGRYPGPNQFREIVIHNKVLKPVEWILFTNEERTKGSLQYPMNLPILWAPGKAKISEFLPMIYAFIIENPCSLKTGAKEKPKN
jgi:hypothetical protein